MRWVGTGSVTNVLSVDATLKLHLYISPTDTTYDTLLTEYIKSVGLELEYITNRPLTYTAILIHDVCKEGKLQLPANTNTLTKLEYLDGDAYIEQTDINLTTVTRSTFQVGSEIISDLLKEGYVYKITATATVNADDRIKQAARLMLGEKFEKRQNGEVKTYSRDIDFLLSNLVDYRC